MNQEVRTVRATAELGIGKTLVSKESLPIAG